MAWARGVWAQGFVAQLRCDIANAVGAKAKIEDYLPEESKPPRRVTTPEEFERFCSRFKEYKPNG